MRSTMLSLRAVKLTDKALLATKISVATTASGREIRTDRLLVACPVLIVTMLLMVATPRRPGKAFTQGCAVATIMIAAMTKRTQPTTGGYLPSSGKNASPNPAKTSPSHASPSSQAAVIRRPLSTCDIVEVLRIRLIIRRDSTPNSFSAGQPDVNSPSHSGT